MQIEKATPDDFPAVFSLYQSATQQLCAQGIDQWDAHYPDAACLRADLAAGTLYLVWQENELAAAFAINQEQDAEYAEGAWQGVGLPFAVLHRLCVTPSRQGQGLARQVMLALENMLRQEDVAVLRLDAFVENPAALRLYDKLGYTRVGEVQFDKGQFYLYEKIL